ncbi:ABC transporter permease [Phyllobacterium myrsinacearum]|uniref:ABC transporter permease n=1 Tax=Phyllobacterium myrsinacearum TaxID=28101 RepID=A0A2S9JR04_9HYPH|nr:ABC transporter permease [Phyllobacterium myrsinacearum]PRD55589.1 ABC transporter permease [Phyllobacterium myrsinacearum]PWV91945.1 putative spermidine/putrescine transport system permease protein [Phyllobacterium myrsinacearum]RZV06012.1 putative spermidine/putrescine transport system permease protein [Phyllobacterium myrsinacearum]
MGLSVTADGGRKTPWRDGSFGYVVPALLLIAFFFIVPVIMLLMRSVLEPTPGLQNYRELLGSTTYLRVLLNTFTVAGLVTIVSVLIGFPIAWLLAIMPERWSRLVLAIIVLSMWTNLLARTYAWMVLLQRTGVVNKVLLSLGIIDKPLALVNNLVGVSIGMTYIMLPFIILPLIGVLKSIDPAILRAAALCGANKRQCFTRVLLPLSLPGIASGALMVFVMSLGYYVTPALLGGTSNMMLAELVAQFVQSLVNWGMGGAAALVLLLVTLVLYTIQLKFVNPNRAR